MPLSLSAAEPADAARIAEIHMAAFGSNAMLLAQFPTPAVRDALKKSIELKALADIDDPKTTVLVVRDSSLELGSNSAISTDNERTRGRRKEQVVAFAKWAHPVRLDEDYVEPPWIWPAGTNLVILNDWAKKAEAAQSRALGNTPCYRLTFMGTDPAHRRRGAATMMVRWGMEHSRKDGAPAYLESTLEAASFYRNIGFVDVDTISLEYRADGAETRSAYEEVSFLYR
ncbi:putative GNAT family acetyltransferase [Daldinia decipiens]|uniref:putative GNAT family acetyltransferase n=1 Tax=Daldinia decipiens TaxID=326647 RepID=UPI0020C230DF|nr:putative GNAT family acetyltransferase [Daldinia decipiens]KAI1655135.1 putative GNAT family acetyltransferase [Daldinia decipiens]